MEAEFVSHAALLLSVVIQCSIARAVMSNSQDATCFQQNPGATGRVFNCRSLLDQNVKLSVEETLPDPRYVQLQDEEELSYHEIQATLSVLRFPDALLTCLRRCLTATWRVFRCCCWHCSDYNVLLSVEETEPVLRAALGSE